MTQKWSLEQINVLIDAYKKEPCLYATNTPNYHNKYLRTAALNRVSNAVLRLRPTVTAKECSSKFHNLRNQFNIEHTKVKSSLKSGTGTDDVYTPSLWYYEKLLFLESYVIPRKNRTSFGSEVSLSDVPLSQNTVTHKIEANPEDANCYENIEYVEDIFIPELDKMIQAQKNRGSSTAEQVLDINSTSLHRPRRLSASPSPQRSRSSSLSSVTANNQQEDVVFPRPNTSTQSGSSTSGVCISGRRKKKNPRLDDSDEFSTVIKNLTNSINTPIAVNTPPTNSTPDSVDGFLTFMGSLLRGFQDEELKLELMNQVTQLIINVKTTDYQRSKK